MTVTKSDLINYGYARGLTLSFLLLSASGIMGHEDHVILRFIVCSVALWGVRYALALKNRLWTILLGAGALVFNPVWHPHGLGRPVWIGLDLAVVAVFAASIVGLSSR
ncbi:MAG: hypothetical protein HY077_14145 [Elusimicrobia bacterium]|nr:hypothetical protein [Elusimicrobiota bacterium]